MSKPFSPLVDVCCLSSRSLAYCTFKVLSFLFVPNSASKLKPCGSFLNNLGFMNMKHNRNDSLCSSEGTAPPDVPDLRRLRLHPVPNVPWQQDVRVSQLLHGFLQSPQVHFLQRERPAAVCELQPVRMLSAWPDILASRLWNQNTGASTGLNETQQDSSSTAIDSKDNKKMNL